MPSEFHERWYYAALEQLEKAKEGNNWELPKLKVELIRLVFYPATRRSSDLTNRAESVMDALVHAKILKDDNWFVCGRLELFFAGVDKQNPRVEAEIIV